MVREVRTYLAFDNHGDRPRTFLQEHLTPARKRFKSRSQISLLHRVPPPPPKKKSIGRNVTLHTNTQTAPRRTRSYHTGDLNTD